MPTLKQLLANVSAASIDNGGYVEFGYGQVEPNHLSAQRTGQIYAQLPAAASIEKLEQGQFVKYDYAKQVVDFDGPGEWMLVFNEIKLYRDGQWDCEFAMLKDNYQARVYSPFGGSKDGLHPDTVWQKQSRYYNGVDDKGATSITLREAVEAVYAKTEDEALVEGKTYYSDENGTVVEEPAVEDIANYYEMVSPAVPALTYEYDDVTAGPDMYELHYNEDPFHIESLYREQMMPEGTQMVPRVFKTNVGDIYTTNMIAETDLALEDELSPRTEDGILCKDGDGSIVWQVVKVYTMPDHQKGVKIMRIA